MLFRLTRAVLLDLCNSLEPRLTRGGKKPQPIPPHVTVLSALACLDTRTVQKEAGDQCSTLYQASAIHTLSNVPLSANKLR